MYDGTLELGVVVCLWCVSGISLVSLWCLSRVLPQPSHCISIQYSKASLYIYPVVFLEGGGGGLATLCCAVAT